MITAEPIVETGSNSLYWNKYGTIKVKFVYEIDLDYRLKMAAIQINNRLVNIWK